MASLATMAEELYEAVNKGDVDTVMDLLKRGANVNVLASCGRTVLGRAAQLGHLAIVCLLLDADKFYSTPEEEEPRTDIGQMTSPADSPTSPEDSVSGIGNCISLSSSAVSPVTFSTSLVRSDTNVPSPHKCCSPSIDSETCTCSDELWGLDLSDNNTGGHLSDREPLSGIRQSTQTEAPQITSKEGSPECVGRDDGISTITSSQHPSSHYPTTLSSSVILGCYNFDFKLEKKLSTKGSWTFLRTTIGENVVVNGKRPYELLLRTSMHISMYRTLGRGRVANIVSSDSEFETEKRRRRRHGRHNHRSSHHRHDREHKSWIHPGQQSSPWLEQLQQEYLALGLACPWSLTRACDINQQDVYGRSALHYSTEQGHAYIVHMLIKAGIRVDTPDAEHMTALHLAAQRGLAEVSTLLLESGARVNNKMNDKSSPLHIAASRGYTDIVEMLLDRGAKIDSLDSSDRTPLILAVSRSHHKVVQLLIQRGAKVNIEEIHGYTPLCEAVWHKDIKLVQMLLGGGSKVTQSHYLLHHAVLHRQYQLGEMLLGARCIVNLRDDNGDTPLIVAARTCQPNMIRLLLKHGANANYPNGLTGTTPLHEAVEGTRDAQFADFETVFYLLHAHGARLDVETVMTGDTPLYRALLLEKNKAAALLIRQGCNSNHPTPHTTPDYLHMASLRGHAPLATLLVLSGFNLWAATWLSASHTPGTLMHTLNKLRCSPLKLSDICRIRIRRQLGERVEATVKAASLPPRVTNFLMLQDVDGVDL
ncbi:unnamed protein product, partial [Meganyctiphanes norvegica]